MAMLLKAQTYSIEDCSLKQEFSTLFGRSQTYTSKFT